LDINWSDFSRVRKIIISDELLIKSRNSSKNIYR